MFLICVVTDYKDLEHMLSLTVSYLIISYKPTLYTKLGGTSCTLRARQFLPNSATASNKTNKNEGFYYSSYSLR